MPGRRKQVFYRLFTDYKNSLSAPLCYCTLLAWYVTGVCVFKLRLWSTMYMYISVSARVIVMIKANWMVHTLKLPPNFFGRLADMFPTTSLDGAADLVGERLSESSLHLIIQSHYRSQSSCGRHRQNVVAPRVFPVLVPVMLLKCVSLHC